MAKLSIELLSFLILTSLVILPNISAIESAPSDYLNLDYDHNTEAIYNANEQRLEEKKPPLNTGNELNNANSLVKPEKDSKMKQDLQELEALQTMYRDRVKSTTTKNGITSLNIYTKPVFYSDGPNGQQLIDTKIELNTNRETNDNYQYQSIKNNIKLYFQDKYSPSENSDLIYLSQEANQYPLSWQPLGLSLGTPTSVFDSVGSSASGADIPLSEIINLKSAKGSVEENTIVYEDIFPGCDGRYTALPNKLKHDLILDENPMENIEEISEKGSLNPEDTSTLDYYGILTLPKSLKPYIGNTAQQSVFETTKPIILRNSDGTIVYKISPPIAYEQIANDDPITCTYQFKALGTSGDRSEWCRTMVTLKTDLTWLSDSHRNYPIVIDPSIEPQPDAEEGLDTYLVDGRDAQPELIDQNFGNSTELKVSLAGPSIFSKKHGFYRSILKFPGVNIISSHAQVQKAILTLQSMATEGSMSISVFKLFDDWLEGNGTETNPGTTGATWNTSGYNLWSGGNYDGDNSDSDSVYVSGQSGTYEWDITYMVADWVSEPSTNHGLLLTGTDKEDVIKSFYSSDTLGSTIRPKILVDYNTPPIHTGLDTIIVSEDDKEIAINLTDIFYDPDVILHNDILSFKISNETEEKKTGTLFTENVTVDLRGDGKLYIKPAGSERSGWNNFTVHAQDITMQGMNQWLDIIITVKLIESNDPPEIVAVSGAPVLHNTVELDAVENVWKTYDIEIYDPDNTELLEENTIKKHDEPGDLEFRWEKDKANKFTIAQEKTENVSADPPYIAFTPDNSLVGTLYINITVYDTVWSKPYDYSKLKKLEVSNHTIMLIITIENTNNPPNKPRILEPYSGSEFSTDEMITFKGTCTDPDFLIPNTDEELTYSWHSSLDGNLDYDSEINSRLSKGNHLITLIVEDSKGERSETNMTTIVRNRATIDNENCSIFFTDESEDIICFYYYYYSQEDEEIFAIERDTFPEYNVYIDIIELASIRYQNYLLINLTVNENLSLQLGSKNFKYQFSVYLIKPGHQEKLPNLIDAEYDVRRFEALYEPKPHEYYAVFGLDDGKIINDGRTLQIKKHLGDLEIGEGVQSKLEPGFSLFATMKVEIRQHLADSFEHIVCYDAAGSGAEVAPVPQKKVKTEEKVKDELDMNIIIPTSIIVVTIVIIVLFGLFMLLREARLKKKIKKEKEEKGKAKVDARAQIQLQGPGVMGRVGAPGAPLMMPPQGMLVPPPMFPGMGMPGGPPMFRPMMPPGQFPGYPGGPSPPMSKKDKKKKKKKWKK